MAHGQYLILCDLLSAAEIVILMGMDPMWELPLNSVHRERRMENARNLMRFGETEWALRSLWTSAGFEYRRDITRNAGFRVRNAATAK